MDFQIKYLKKEFNHELLNLIQIVIDDKNFDFYLKKNELNELCIFGDNSYIVHLNKIISKIMPGMEFMINLLLANLKPVQINLDVDNLIIKELYLSDTCINTSVENVENLLNSNNLLDSLTSNLFGMVGNKLNLTGSLPLKSKIKETYISSNSSSSSESNESDELEQSVEFDSSVNLNLKQSISLTSLTSLSESSDNLSNNSEDLNGINISLTDNLINKVDKPNLFFDKIKNVWTNDYYDNIDDQYDQDDIENLDDFILDNKSSEKIINLKLTKYLKFNHNDIMFEICLSNFSKFDIYETIINTKLNKETFDQIISQCEKDNNLYKFPNSTRKICTDDNGEKYFSYNIKIGNFSTEKNIKYGNIEKIRILLTKLLTFIKSNEF